MSSPYTKANVLSNLVHFVVGRGLSGIAGFLMVLLMVKFMDIDSYAGFTSLTGLIAVSGVLSGFGLDRAISRFLPEARLSRTNDEMARFIWSLAIFRLITSLVICTALYLSWNLITMILKDINIIKFPMVLALFIIAESLFQYFSSVYQALIQQKMLTKIMAIQSIGRLLMIYVVIVDDGSIRLDESIWVMALPEVLGVMVFTIYLSNHLKALKKHAQSNQQSADKWPKWSEIIELSLHNYAFLLLASPPQGYFMKILAGAFLPTQMVAAYGFFINISEKVRQYLPLNFGYNLIEPLVVGNYLENRNFHALNKKCIWLYKANLLVLVPFIAWVATSSIQISSAISGDKFLDHHWIFLLVVIQLIVGSHVVLLQLILNSIGKSEVLVRSGTFSLILMVIYWLVATMFDVSLLLFGPILFSLTCNILILSAIKKFGYDYQASFQMYLGIVVSGLLSYGVGLELVKQLSNYFHSTALISLMSGLLILLIYLCGLYLFNGVTKDEITFLKSLKKIQK